MRQQDLAFSNRFLNRVKSIVGPQILVKTSFEVDSTEAADLTTLKDRAVRVAVRIRRPAAYKWPYWNQITLRDSGSSKSLSEVDKIVSGLGDLLFYGFAQDEESDSLSRWFLIDLSKLRLHYSQCLQNSHSLGRAYGVVRPDGSEDFVWFDASKFPPGVVLDSKITTYSSALPKTTGLWGALAETKLRRDIYLRMTAMLDFYELRIEHEMSAGELLQKLGNRVPKGFALQGLIPESTLHNVVTYASGVPIFAIQDRPMLDYIPDSWNAGDLLKAQLRVSVYRELGLPVLEWSIGVDEHRVGEFIVESNLIERISKNPSSPFALERQEPRQLDFFTVTNPSGATREYYDYMEDVYSEFEEDLKEAGARDVEVWEPTRDVDGTTVCLCIVELSDNDSVFGIGRCQEFDFPPITPSKVAKYLAKSNAHLRAYGVLKGEVGSDKPEALGDWREQMRRLGSNS